MFYDYGNICLSECACCQWFTCPHSKKRLFLCKAWIHMAVLGRRYLKRIFLKGNKIIAFSDTFQKQLFKRSFQLKPISITDLDNGLSPRRRLALPEPMNTADKFTEIMSCYDANFIIIGGIGCCRGERLASWRLWFFMNVICYSQRVIVPSQFIRIITTYGKLSMIDDIYNAVTHGPIALTWSLYRHQDAKPSTITVHEFICL